MPKARTSKRELEICERLRIAREFLGIAQTSCADQIGVQRGTLANYEIGRTPIKHEIGLRFCHQLIVSEEWLATGKVDSMLASAKLHGVKIGPKDTALNTIFIQQSMDLISEPICRRIPPGMLFSEAYDKFFAARYAELAQKFFHVPRIIYSENDPPSRNVNIVMAYCARWLKLLANEALRLNRNQADVQNAFIKGFLAAGGNLFLKYHQSGLDDVQIGQAVSGRTPEGQTVLN